MQSNNLTVVTGASGHVGANLVRELLLKGRKVRVLVRKDRRALEGLPVEAVEGDVLDKESLVRAFAGADVVYHLAALISITGGQGGLVEKTNVNGAANMVSAALECKVRRVVHFSSIHAYRGHDNRDKVIDETTETALGPENLAYDRSKAMGELEVLKGVKAGLDAVIVNPTSVIGPYDFKPSRMGQLFLDLYNRKIPALVDSGYNHVDVRDLAAGAMLAEERGRTGEKYLLSGEWRHFRELSETVEKVTGRKTTKSCAPLWAAAMAAPFAYGWAKLTGAPVLFTPESIKILRGHRHISCAKAERELGYTRRPVEETVRDIYAWYRSAGIIKD